MLSLQGLAAQRAGGTAGEGAWHQIMPIAAAAATHFLFSLSLFLLPPLFLLLFFTVLTLQRNKKSKQREVFYMQMCVFSLVHSAWLGVTLHNRVRGRIYNRVCVSGLVTCVCSNMHTRKGLHLRIWSFGMIISPYTPLQRDIVHRVSGVYVYLIFIEGASHPVPQRAERLLHLGAFLRLL